MARAARCGGATVENLNGGNGSRWQPLAHADHEATAGTLLNAPVGEIIDTSVAEFSAQACELNVAPPFGGFVKVTGPDRTVYGVVFAIHTGSLEPGGRAVL